MHAALPLTLLTCALLPGYAAAPVVRPAPALCQLVPLPSRPSDEPPSRVPRRPLKKAVLCDPEQDPEDLGRALSLAQPPDGCLPAGPDVGAGPRKAASFLLRPGAAPDPLHLRLSVLLI